VAVTAFLGSSAAQTVRAGESELGERAVYSARQVRRGIGDLTAAGYLTIAKNSRKNVYCGVLPSVANSQNGGSIASPPPPLLANAPGGYANGASSHGASSNHGFPSEELIRRAKSWIVECLSSRGPLREAQFQAELDPYPPGPEVTERRQAVRIALQQLLADKKITHSGGAYSVAQ
jgi:hypothetical protein